jgi:hypothetical protein
VGSTPLSTDPVVATSFASQAQTVHSPAEGVVYGFTREDLGGIALDETQTRRLGEKEAEVVALAPPAEVAERASVVLTVDEARQILSAMGRDVPGKVYSPGHLSDVLDDVQKLSDTEREAFYLAGRIVTEAKNLESSDEE